MSAIIHPFPSTPAKLTCIRGLADHVAAAIVALGAEADLAVPALCSVIFEIATNAADPGLGRQTAESLHMVAGLLEKHCS